MTFPKVNKMNKEAAVRGENSKGLNILKSTPFTFIYCTVVQYQKIQI